MFCHLSELCRFFQLKHLIQGESDYEELRQRKKKINPIHLVQADDVLTPLSTTA